MPSEFRLFSADADHAPQTRRVVRTTRATAVKENENANPRLTRASTRTKPVSSTSGLAGGVGGVTRATAASRAKSSGIADSKLDIHAGKRKREALGEVTIPSNKPAIVAGKGKEKETFDGVVLKAKGVATRQPLRTVAGTRQTAANIPKKPSAKDVKPGHEVVSLDDENAMIVDPPVALPSLAVRKSNVVKDIQPVNARRVSLRSAGNLPPHREEEPEEEPVHKKRRTSSVAPEDDAQEENEEDVHSARIAAEMEAFANEVEADPENSAWDDLDADDSDDPLMVSEYVQDIFGYLKQVEVNSNFSVSHNFC